MYSWRFASIVHLLAAHDLLLSHGLDHGKKQLLVLARHDRLKHVVGGRRDILLLGASEDVEGDHVDLGVTVLTSLGSGGLHDLAGTVLDDDERPLLQVTGHDRHGKRGTGTAAGLERLYLWCFVVAHDNR